MNTLNKLFNWFCFKVLKKEKPRLRMALVTSKDLLSYNLVFRSLESWSEGYFNSYLDEDFKPVNSIRGGSVKSFYWIHKYKCES